LKWITGTFNLRYDVCPCSLAIVLTLIPDRSDVGQQKLGSMNVLLSAAHS